MHDCTEEEFIRKFPDIDSEYHMRFRCLDDLSKGTFRGTLEQPNKNFFTLLLQRCDTFENLTCKSKEQIDEFLEINKSAKVLTYISTEIYDQNIYETSPVKVITSSQYLALSDLDSSAVNRFRKTEITSQ